MSDPIGVMTFLSGNIDAAMEKFVVQTSAALSAGIAPVIATGLMLWFTLYGLAVMRGEVQEPLMGFVKKSMNITLICAFGLGTGLYQDMIVGSVYDFLNGLTQMVSPGSSNIFVALDQYDKKVSEQTLVIIGHGMTKLPTGGWLDLLAGLIISVANAALMILCGGFAVVAKVALSLVLAFGPIFILCLAFPTVARLFESWLSTVLSKILLSVYLAAVATFSIIISGDYMDRMIANTGVANAMSDAFGFVVINGALLVVAYQLPQIAAGMTGGISVTGGGLAAFMMGKLTNRKGGGNEGEKGDTGSPGGGSVANGSSSATGGGAGSSQAASNSTSIPAYRRATLDRLGKT